MFRYDCPLCRSTSKPYLLRKGAEEKGVRHRSQRHDDMHPEGESILVEGFTVPQRGDWKMAALVAGLLLMGLVSKLL
ncbi:hypothetical protein [Streptomyces sp. NPDC047070]|uniref:hypothetical protein n=1 Tax=Streptomyces sp. NPDC047070 TaxID=3154923 RepID=UPI00345154D8